MNVYKIVINHSSPFNIEENENLNCTSLIRPFNYFESSVKC